jgi:hypothetical protein
LLDCPLLPLLAPAGVLVPLLIPPLLPLVLLLVHGGDKAKPWDHMKERGKLQQSTRAAAAAAANFVVQ